VAAREYSDAQRDALVMAFAQPKVTANRVAELAAAGELVDADGQPLEAFTVPASTIRDLARQARLAEARGSQLADGPPQDAIEALRRRAIKIADAELTAVEAQPEGERDLERFRRAIRCVHDAARIPRPPEPRPRPEEPDQGSSVAGDGVGPLLREHRATLPAPPPTDPESDLADGAQAPESPMDRFRREAEARIERLRENVERERREAEPVAAPEPDLSGDRPRRSRWPDEDTSSCW
jgi:hypothetical protein